jgi:HlyD family secretion protein
MKKRMPIIIAALAIAVLGAFVAGRRGHFLYAGTVEALTVELSSRLLGTIENITVQEGDAVKKGSLLVSISGDDVRVAAEAAGRDYRRAAQLLADGSMNRETFDRLKFKYDDAMVRLSWCTITSPLEGTVRTRYHEPGELVSPGTKLLMLEDLSTVWAYIYIAHDKLAKIQTGMNIDGLVPEAGMKTIPGKIIKINQEAEFTPKNVQTRSERTRLVYGVKISFNNPDRSLKPGMTIEVKLPD